MKEKAKLELFEIIEQLSLPYLMQVLSFANKFLQKQNREIKNKE